MGSLLGSLGIPHQTDRMFSRGEYTESIPQVLSYKSLTSAASWPLQLSGDCTNRHPQFLRQCTWFIWTRGRQPILPSGDISFLRSIIYLMIFDGLDFLKPSFFFPWNSTPFSPSPRVRLNHQIRAKHLLQSTLTQSTEGLGECVRCFVRFSSVWCFVRFSSVLSGCTDYGHWVTS